MARPSAAPSPSRSRCTRMAACTDLTQCTATELLDLYRSGAASPVEATRAVLDRIEARQPDDQRLLPRRRRRGAGRGGGERGALAARRADRTARRRADVDQGPHPHQGLADAAGQPHRRPRPAVGRRRAGDGPPARGRRRAARQDDDARVRLQGRDQLGADRDHAQPVGPDEDAGRLVGRHGGGRRRRAAARSASAPTAPGRCASRPRSAATSGSSRASGGCRRTRCRRSAPCRTSARTR